MRDPPCLVRLGALTMSMARVRGSMQCAHMMWRVCAMRRSCLHCWHCVAASATGATDCATCLHMRPTTHCNSTVTSGAGSSLCCLRARAQTALLMWGSRLCARLLLNCHLVVSADRFESVSLSTEQGIFDVFGR